MEQRLVETWDCCWIAKLFCDAHSISWDCCGDVTKGKTAHHFISKIKKWFQQQNANHDDENKNNLMMEDKADVMSKSDSHKLWPAGFTPSVGRQCPTTCQCTNCSGDWQHASGGLERWVDGLRGSAAASCVNVVPEVQQQFQVILQRQGQAAHPMTLIFHPSTSHHRVP